ncbi:MAG: hypothetical protein ACE5H2_08650 [Terriglobia bacterium]
MTEPCRHPRTQLIAQDEATTFLECLDCGKIFEADELEEPPNFDESLSDA